MAPSTKNGEAMEALHWYSQLQARKLGDDYVEGASEEDFNDKGGFEYLAIFLFLLATVFILCKFLHDRPRLASILPEAGMIVLVGMVASAIIYLLSPSLVDKENNYYAYVDDDQASSKTHEDHYGLLSFSPNIFFEILLPPIIFNSGYHINRELFCTHIRPILCFALLGTFLNIFVTASLLNVFVSSNLTGDFQPQFVELLAFASLIASTDPVAILSIFQKKKVDPQLFYLVFGESVLNDGVALVLFEYFTARIKEGNSGTINALTIFCDFITSFVGSFFLGCLSGLVVAYILKQIDMRQTRLLELNLYVLVMYLPYFVSESVGMSGIVTILFTGIAAKRYAEPNLSAETKIEADVLFRIVSHLAEAAIFLELGLSLFGLFLGSFEGFHVKFIGWALLTCLIGRACSIYPMTFLHNAIEYLGSPGICCTIHDFDPEDAHGYKAHDSVERNNEIPLEQQHQEPNLTIRANAAHMICFAGLRGAVAYACSRRFPDEYGNRNSFVVITMAIVLVTVFVLGGISECVMNLLNIDTNVEDDPNNNRGRCRVINLISAHFLDPLVLRYEEEDKQPDLCNLRCYTDLTDVVKDILAANCVEMTIADHERIVRECSHMTRPKTNEPETPRRQASYDIYDFGEINHSDIYSDI